MRMPVSEAKANLTELVRRAEAGEEVILTRHGKQTVQLVPVTPVQTPEERRAIIAEIRARAAGPRPADENAARSQDFLYDENGLPG
ncbi:MAG TPA: type II toxin-antitoxin system prevent-host-death family antitoxin [Rhizobium sp.]|nr:type II toxin-antitoxin system prevent-host-death family antitoxin [Rhizobium sp.]